ncbi:MAG: hypothetical protein NTW82_04295 [Bacteroidia bacterium]|nr:hypothetical protein [Bacteroidia bacterium]
MQNNTLIPFAGLPADDIIKGSLKGITILKPSSLADIFSSKTGFEKISSKFTMVLYKKQIYFSIYLEKRKLGKNSPPESYRYGKQSVLNGNND